MAIFKSSHLFQGPSFWPSMLVFRGVGINTGVWCLFLASTKSPLFNQTREFWSPISMKKKTTNAPIDQPLNSRKQREITQTQILYTLPETNSSPLKMDGWKVLKSISFWGTRPFFRDDFLLLVSGDLYPQYQLQHNIMNFYRSRSTPSP